MRQVDYREEDIWFSAHNENHGLATWEYEGGTCELAVTVDGRRRGDDSTGVILARGLQSCHRTGRVTTVSFRRSARVSVTSTSAA